MHIKKHITNLTEKTPTNLFIISSLGMGVSFFAWMLLINNFSYEEAAFTGKEIGIMQSIREIPGLLAFLAIFILIFMREQSLLVISLLLLGLGVAATAYHAVPSWIYVMTLIMSIGFHYFETARRSLCLQYINKKDLPVFMGQLVSIKNFISLLIYTSIFLLLSLLSISYFHLFIIFGLMTVGIALFCYIYFPQLKHRTVQSNRFLLNRSYWLFYLLTLFKGARRQIFVVFSIFLMVEKFDTHIEEISIVFIANCLITTVFSPYVGKLINIFGERKILVIEYFGLICVFTLYAIIDNIYIVIVLYILDHVFFSMSFAIDTYLNKIVVKDEISSTVSIAFSIDHITAVFLPFLLGLVWLVDNSYVFFIGAFLAFISLFLSLAIPRHPTQGNETIFTTKR